MLNNLTPFEILIADDQETDAFFVEQAFNQSKIDNIVHRVHDGNEVLDFVRKQGDFVNAPRPSLIILDLSMPGKSGFEALKEIKEDKDLCDIPVIIMSAKQDQADINRAYKLHANAFIPKSNGFENMLDFVQSIESFWFLKARLPKVEE